MLTKDLLRYRIRIEKVYPGFVDVSDAALLTFVESIHTLFSAGTTEQELQETACQLGLDVHPLYAGIKKIFLDQCDLAESQGEVETQRWQIIEEAQRLRQDTLLSSIAQYQEQVSHLLQKPTAQLQMELYQDLPQYRPLLLKAQHTASDWLHRYNCALIQGLLIHAKKVYLEVGPLSVAQRRELLRSLKFHRLLVSFPEGEWTSDAPYAMEISGPLDLFEKTTLYGMNLAAFFPRVLHVPMWKLQAELVLKKKLCLLSLTHQQGLRSHYTARDHYVPEELPQFTHTFQGICPDWRVEAASAFFPMGKNTYCCPDFVFEHTTGKKVYVELFHRWHSSQVVSRIEALETGTYPGILLGICKSIAKQKSIQDKIEKSQWFQRNGFIFTEFPRAKVVSSLLETCNTR